MPPLRPIGLCAAVLAAGVAAVACGSQPSEARPAARVAAPSHGLLTAFFDPRFTRADAGGVERLADARASGARAVRVQADWRSIAMRRPRNPADPSDPAYRWGTLDAAVEAAVDHGFRILLTFSGSPEWAAQTRRPRRYVSGTFKPQPRAVGAFATALARRYRHDVEALQVWNEPNLENYLSPQWIRRGGRLRPFAPGHYRRMLRAAYPGVHAAGVMLVTAGTGPYGDPGRGGTRIRPLSFWKWVFAKHVRFDAISHHPYSVGGPRQRALNRNDMALPDVHRLVAAVRAGVRAGRIGPRGRKPLWVTELSWDSSPPDPDGVPAARHARWLADALFVLWKQGASRVYWFQVRDAPPDPSYGASHQSGVYLVDGRPKRAEKAFAFPFSCERTSSGTRVWARPPAKGRVAIVADGTIVKRFSTGADGIAYGVVGSRGRMRASQSGSESLSCRS